MKITSSKVLLVFMIIGIIFSLVSCGGNNKQDVTKTLSAQFLQKSDEDLLAIVQSFDYVRRDYSIFNKRDILDVNDISAQGMYVFFTCTCDAIMDYYDKTDNKYHFPTGDIQSYINQFFEDYKFDPVSVYQAKYNAKDDTLVNSALPSPGPNFIELVKKERRSDNTVLLTVNYFNRCQDADSQEIIWQQKVTLKITDSGYKYVSAIQGDEGVN